MFPNNNLFTLYKDRLIDNEFSASFPDVTTRATLSYINSSINLCEYWNAVLDIGCGAGYYLAPLAGKFKNAVGVEIDVFPDQHTLSKKYPNISFVNIPLEKYQKTEKFDFVLMMDIFEHIPDISASMKHIAELQPKGGIVHIVTPNPLYCGPASESALFHKKIGYHGHIKHYTKKEIIEICSGAGYELEYCLYEETKVRDIIRRISKGLSRRDRTYTTSVAYKCIQPFVYCFFLPIFWFFEEISWWYENKHKDDMFTTRSLVMAFKKK